MACGAGLLRPARSRLTGNGGQPRTGGLRNVVSPIHRSVLTTITEGTANRVDKSLHAMDKYTDMKL